MPTQTLLSPPAQVPTALHASIGGFCAPSFDLLLEPDGRLRYFEGYSCGPSPASPAPRWQPQAADWAQFLAALEAAKVFRWKPSYDDLRILDGTQWAWRLELGGRVYASSGSNAYPPRAQFRAWQQALSVLAQGRAFGF